MAKQSDGSVKIGVINPGEIDSALLDKMDIDTGIRTLVSTLLRHGYQTTFSCEGHGTDQPYVSFRRGTGDGTFEREAKSRYGLQPRKRGICCRENTDPFCRRCGTSEKNDTYIRSEKQPFTLAKTKYELFN